MATMRNNNEDKGFSLVEVMMATLIFAIAAAGLFSTFRVQREYSNRSERKLQAAYCGRQVLEELRAKVDQRNWDSGDLQEGNHTYNLFSSPCNIFTATYTVTNVVINSVNTGGRKVSLNVTWNEP